MEDSEFKAEWHEMLRELLDDFRARNPSDERTDRELVESLMEHFISCGVVQKVQGKYRLPELLPDGSEQNLEQWRRSLS